MGAGRRQRRWTIALRGHRQHIRHNRLVRRNRVERRRSRPAPFSRPRATDRKPRLFRPSNWRDLDRRDLDLGGTAAIPLDVVGPNGARKLIFAIGKTGEAYLLDRDNLGGVGGALANARVTTNIAITSPAVWSAADGVFVVLQGDGAHCPRGEPADGLIALKIRVDPAPAIETAWCGSVAQAGSPIVTTTDGRSDPIVLVVGAEGDNRLHAFRADSGEPLATPSETMRGLHHFQTLIAAEDRLYVAADDTIYAFAF